MSDDFIIDDLGNSNRPRKRPNSGRIGKGGERELAKIFSERFVNHPPFSRVIGSGNRIYQVQLSEEAKGLLASDLTCPPLFKFVIECKMGYDHIDLGQAMAEGNHQLEKFLNQAKESAKIANKLPIVCWRKRRKPWLVFIEKIDTLPDNYVIYKDWIGMSIEELLKMPESFFFNKS